MSSLVVRFLRLAPSSRRLQHPCHPHHVWRGIARRARRKKSLLTVVDSERAMKSLLSLHNPAFCLFGLRLRFCERAPSNKETNCRASPMKHQPRAGACLASSSVSSCHLPLWPLQARHMLSRAWPLAMAGFENCATRVESSSRLARVESSRTASTSSSSPRISRFLLFLFLHPHPSSEMCVCLLLPLLFSELRALSTQVLRSAFSLKIISSFSRAPRESRSGGRVLSRNAILAIKQSMESRLVVPNIALHRFAPLLVLV